MKYITAPDIGTSSKEMDYIVKNFGKGSATRTSKGIPHGSGMTGYGIALTARKALGDLTGKLITISGFGCVGANTAKFLTRMGAEVIIADIDQKKIIGKGFLSASADSIFKIPADAFIPCCASDVIDEKNYKQIKAKIIIEGGNCQIAEGIKEKLRAKGIVVIDDFVASGGGIIASHCELQGWSLERAFREIKKRMG